MASVLLRLNGACLLYLKILHCCLFNFLLLSGRVAVTAHDVVDVEERLTLQGARMTAG